MALLAHRSAPSPLKWTDAELLRRVLRKDEHAWCELVRRFRSLVYRCITKVISRYEGILSSADADEVYGEVLVTLLRDDMRKLRLYDAGRGTKLSSWIGMITTNTTYDFLRQTARRPVLDRVDGVPEVDSFEESPLERVLAGERRGELNELLSGYSDKDRTFVSLYYAHGMEAEDVAAEMGISVKTVYSKKHKLLARLQRTLMPVYAAA